jgi:hypothetical protein
MTRNQAKRADTVIDEFLQGHLDEETLEESLIRVLDIPFLFMPEDHQGVLDLDLIRGYTS